MADTSDAPSKTLCAYPWVHVRIERIDRFTPCCNFLGTPPKFDPQGSLEDILHSPFLENIRQQMKNGESVEGCRLCYEHEASGVMSTRQSINEKYPDAWKASPQIQYAEYNLGNLCNLTCRGCDSSSSSKWFSEEKKLNKKTSFPVFNRGLELLGKNTETVKYFKLIGGEPLLFKEHDEFIRRLGLRSDLNEVSLEYNTNGTLRVQDSILEIWKRCHFVSLTVSIDGLREGNDFFRHGSKWKEVIENLKWYAEHLKPMKNKKVGVHTVVNIYNIHEIPEMDEWLLNEIPGMELTKELLRQPTYLSPRNLPAPHKEILIEYYNRWLNKPTLSEHRRGFYKFLTEQLQLPSMSSFRYFMEQDFKINTLWKTSLQEVNPWLYRIIENPDSPPELPQPL